MGEERGWGGERGQFFSSKQGRDNQGPRKKGRIRDSLRLNEKGEDM